MGVSEEGRDRVIFLLPVRGNNIKIGRLIPRGSCWFRPGTGPSASSFSPTPPQGNPFAVKTRVPFPIRAEFRPVRRRESLSAFFRLRVLFLLFSVGALLLAAVFPSRLAADGFEGYTPGFFDPDAEPAEGDWRESFEQEGVSWVPLYQEPDVKITFQQRTGDSPHSGERAEEIVLEFPSSGYAFLGHYVDYPILFNETRPALWLRADHPGISLGMLVVLPQTKRSDTETPLTLLLPGTTYRQTGKWEELSFEKDPAALLDETVKAIRAEHKIKVNPEGAYIRQLVLFTEQPRGAVRLWVDDIRIEGHASQSIAILDEAEQIPAFDPVNLLAYRYLVTASPIVMQAASDKLRRWPTEPFAIGAEKPKQLAEARQRKRIEKSKEFVSVYSSSKEHSIPDTGDLPPGKGIAEVDFADSGKGSFSTADYAEEGHTSPLILGSGTRLAAADFPASASQAAGVPRVRFNERTLLINDTTPTAIRAIEYQGEPLSFLKGLRFNAVWLKSPPTPQLLAEARDENIWLIAPPPTGQETVGTAGLLTGNAAYFNGTTVSDDYNKVLIWYLGEGLTENHCQTVAERVEQLKKLDPYRRPVAANVLTGLRAYSDRAVDLLLVKRQPLLSSLDMEDYGLWLRRYPSLMFLGAPFWNEIQTQPDDQLLAQCRFFGAVDEMPSLISYEQIRQQVRLCLAANSHGFLFASHTPLNAEDHETQYRACALELINLELLLIDSWAAGGTAEDVVPMSQDGMSAAILRTKATSLVLPISTEPKTQLVFGAGAANSRSFVAPAREGYSADLLIPGNLRKIPSHRRAGGIDLELDEVSMNSLIFLAQSNWYTRVVAEMSPAFGDRMAELAIRLAKMRIDTYRETIGRLDDLKDRDLIPRVRRQLLVTPPENSSAFDDACAQLTIAENELRRGDAGEAYLQAERALREIRMSERRLWQIGTRFDQCLPVLPVSIAFSTLPAYIESYDKIASGKVRLTGENRLVGGDIERPEDWTNGHWRRADAPFAGVTASLRRDPQAAYRGLVGLTFQVDAETGGGPQLTEVPPLTVEVPANVRVGELVCVQGWIRIDQPLAEGTDGFMIYENHGGISLAQRFYKTNEWQRFAFYRYAAADGDMLLTFSLSTYGTVRLDEISVQPVR